MFEIITKDFMVVNSLCSNLEKDFIYKRDGRCYNIVLFTADNINRKYGCIHLVNGLNRIDSTISRGSEALDKIFQILIDNENLLEDLVYEEGRFVLNHYLGYSIAFEGTWREEINGEEIYFLNAITAAPFNNSDKVGDCLDLQKGETVIYVPDKISEPLVYNFKINK